MSQHNTGKYRTQTRNALRLRPKHESGPFAQRYADAQTQRKVRVEAAKAFSENDDVRTPLGVGKITSIDGHLGTVRVRIGRLMRDFPSTDIKKL